MTTETIKFKVAMDKEQAALKNTHEVIINVERPANIPDLVWQFAVAQYKVKLQGQIRPNWDKFKADTFPKTLAFGEAIYAKAATATKPVTMESATDFLNTGSELEQLTKKIEMIESMKMDVPQHMWDLMDTLSPAEDVEPIEPNDTPA